MKRDHGLMKDILEQFQEAPKPALTINELTQMNEDGERKKNVSPNLIANLEFLAEYGFIENYNTKDRNIGIFFVEGSTKMEIRDVPLRMTASGHEYLDNLNEEGVWEVIKKDFKDSSVDTVKTVAKDLIKGLINKKITPLLADL